MQSDSNTSTQRNAHANPSDSSVDSSITAFAMEAKQKHDADGVRKNLSSNNNKPPSPDASMLARLRIPINPAVSVMLSQWNRSILSSLQNPQSSILVPKEFSKNSIGSETPKLTTVQCS